MADLSTDKTALRKTAFAARKIAHGAANQAGPLARDHFLASRLHTGATVIAGYCPIQTEIDPTPLMEALHGAGHRLCVPVIQGAGLALKFAEWWPGVALEEGAFRAMIPVGTPMLEPELLIAPLVAFDVGGWRLGYGGGFYDRSLEELRARWTTRAIGLAYAAQQVADIPREPTDQRLDAIVTEAGVIRPI